MAHNAVRVRARPEDVFTVLVDAHAFPGWVVGARRLREVDPGWPARGTCFHHAIGVGPLELRDSTRMVDWERPTCVVLEARFRPAGTAKVTLTVHPRGDGSVVEMDERPLDGPIHGRWGRLLDEAVRLRNAISLRRLRRLVERRATGVGRGG